jgi:formylglycine-generating enzyme required for sulfatase activity
MLDAVGKHDLILIALAGHGLQPTGSTEQFFCPFDANPDKKANLLSLAKLSSDMQASGAGTKLLLVDACRNDPDPGRGRSGVEGNLYSLPPRASNFMAMFSCSAGQKAYETDKAGGGHGVFFHHVIEGLQGKAVIGDEKDVTWDLLSLYVKRRVPASVKEWIGKEKEQRVHAVANVDRESVVLVALEKLSRIELKPPSSDPKRDRLIGNKGVMTDGVGVKLALIPAGEFLMGSATEMLGVEGGRGHRRTRITKDYYIGVTEVTQAQWTAVMATRPWRGQEFSPNGDDYPATDVSDEEAMEFCRRLSVREGARYRLPTEAEWEYACRAGSTSNFCYGDSEERLGEYAWWGAFRPNAVVDPEPFPRKVGLKRPNAFGLYDMHGNVSEWCSDWYKPGDYPDSIAVDPQGPSEGVKRMVFIKPEGEERPMRVQRGGAYVFDVPFWFASFSRNASASGPGSGTGSTGFRVVREP